MHRCRPCLCDRPGDAALVCDAKDDADFSCQNLLCHKRFKELRQLQPCSDYAHRKPPPSVLELLLNTSDGSIVVVREAAAFMSRISDIAKMPVLDKVCSL